MKELIINSIVFSSIFLLMAVIFCYILEKIDYLHDKIKHKNKE